jgi:signal peptidase I
MVSIMSEAGEIPPAVQRKPWLAAVLGFVWPGVGYLYAGSVRSGLLLLLLLGPVEVVLLSLPLFIPVSPANIGLPLALDLTLHGFSALGAGLAARGVARPLPLVSRWYACLAAILLNIALNLFWAHVDRSTLVGSYSNPGGGMQPTIEPGDSLLVEEWAYTLRDPVFETVLAGVRRPRRGELMAFRFPDNPSVFFVKRCIGLPGETVEIRETEVLIDGKPLQESYAQFPGDRGRRRRPSGTRPPLGAKGGTRGRVFRPR